MRIHKYLRKKHFRNKNWKRMRNREHPFETNYPYSYWAGPYTTEEQVKNHFDWLVIRLRGFESGYRYVSPDYNHAPSHFRRRINRRNRAKVRQAMQKINNGRYDVELPTFKMDAAWNYW